MIMATKLDEVLRYFLGVLILCQLSLASIEAHPGRRDSQGGGHHMRATGTYHFHDGPLGGQTFASKAAGSAALAGGQIGSPEAQSSMASASIFFSSSFSFSNSLSRLASAISMLQYLRFQRWKVALEILCARQIVSTVWSVSA